MDNSNRSSLAAYVAQQLHLRDNAKDLPKTLAQMGKEVGVAPATVRRWLKRDHAELWRDYWATVEELWQSFPVALRTTTLVNDLMRDLQDMQNDATPNVLM